MGLFKTADKGKIDPSEMLLEKYGIKFKDDKDNNINEDKKDKTKKK